MLLIAAQYEIAHNPRSNFISAKYMISKTFRKGFHGTEAIIGPREVTKYFSDFHNQIANLTVDSWNRKTVQGEYVVDSLVLVRQSRLSKHDLSYTGICVFTSSRYGTSTTRSIIIRGFILIILFTDHHAGWRGRSFWRVITVAGIDV